MITESIGAAISTTGEEHRLAFLETCVDHWKMALPIGAPLFVTVDNTIEVTAEVVALLRGYEVTIVRVGQPVGGAPYKGRCGVAANKNTGLEALMDAGLEHLFLSDDDTWPKCARAIYDHIDTPLAHSMLGWGAHRRPHKTTNYCAWAWPRGAVLYVRREVVEKIGGMIEAFGQGGHEHVEWSRRIHQAGLTPVPFGSPVSNWNKRALGASDLWHAEDMPKPREGMEALRRRRQSITTVKAEDHDWPHIAKMMKDKDRDTTFVPYQAEANGRLAATMSSHNA